MASWGRGRGDGVYARLRRSPEHYFLALHVGQALFSSLRRKRLCGALEEDCGSGFLRTSLGERKPARTGSTLFHFCLLKLVSYRPLAREMRLRLKFGPAVYDQRARGLL